MSNLKTKFEAYAAKLGDTLTHAVVGTDDRAGYNPDEPYDKEFPVLSWADAAAKIDYEYDSGYGGADCHNVVAWGEKYIYYVHEYDGSTGICALPRNPQPTSNSWGDVCK